MGKKSDKQHAHRSGVQSRVGPALIFPKAHAQYYVLVLMSVVPLIKQLC